MTGVLLALGGVAWEPALVSALPQGTGLRVARRCVDLDDLVVAGCAGAAPVAVVGAALPRLDRDSIARLGAAGVAVVGCAADDGDGRRLAAVGAPRVARIDPGDPAAAAGLVARAVGDALTAGPAPTGRGYSHAAAEDLEPPADDPGSPVVPADVPADPPDARPRGCVVAVWGPPGAPGRTTVAIALADEAARCGVSTLLVDADTRGAAVAPLLGLPDDLPGLAAACRAADLGRLGPDALRGLARAAAPDLRVLTGLPRPDRWPELRPAAFEAVLDVARDLAALVVVDVGDACATDDEVSIDVLAPRRDAAAITALDAADLCVAVAAAEPVGLLRFVPAAAAVREAWPRLPRRVVANRVRRTALGPSPEGGLRELLERHAGITHPVLVPDDRPALDAAVLAARTLAEAAPTSPARLALRDLTREVLRDTGRIPSDAAARRRWGRARRR